MKPPIGFAIATHTRPEQLLHLCQRLNAMFGNPPIAIHHDFSQAPLNTALFTKNILFVQKWIPTSWGNISVVDAQLSALELLYATGDPDWFMHLSATDYPIQTADRILRDLFENEFDLYMDTRRVENLRMRIPKEGLGEQSFRHPAWPQVAYKRYVAIPLCSVKTARKLHVQIENLSVPFDFLTKRFSPFSGPIRCYGGDAWFTGNRRIANLLTERTPLWKTLHRHYKSRQVPDESFYHTVVGNSPGIRVALDNKRYTDWRGCWAHPRILGRDDFPRLLASSRHFARKFDFDPGMLRSLDEAVAEKENDA